MFVCFLCGILFKLTYVLSHLIVGMVGGERGVLSNLVLYKNTHSTSTREQVAYRITE